MQSNELFKIVLSVLPFFSFCALAIAVNLKKEQRGYQFLSMIFGIVYSILAVIRSDKMADDFLEMLEKIIERLTEFSQEHENFSNICQSIIDFINDVDWEFYMIFIINFLMLAMFLVVKGILLPIFKSIWKNDNLFNATSAICYEWSEERRCYVLKSKLCMLRNIMNVYYGVVVLVACVLLAACKNNPDWSGFQATLYPFAIVIIVGEIVFFLGGKTALEFADDLGGEEGRSAKVVNYYRLRKYLTTVFGDRIIAQDTCLPKFYHPHNNSEIVKRFENIDLQEARLANLYFKKKNEQGVKLDEGYVEATYRLMNGESILFANPFYKDYSDYIFLPLNRACEKGKKLLFIIGRTGIENDVMEWIEKSFAQTIDVPDMWKVGLLNDEELFDGDVGVVTPSTIFNNNVSKINVEFLANVSDVVLIEPSQFVSTSQLSIAVYTTSVRKDATYYIIDKNNDGLVDSISHIIRKSIKEVSATNKEHNRYSYMLWKADGQHLSHRIFPNVARYLGVGTELMIAAIRNQVNKTEWYSYSKFPVNDMKWISEQYYSALCDYASLNPKQEELERRMKFDSNMWGVEKDEYKYLVVEDEFCNIFEVSRQFATRGISETFVNVISQNYLLRDYMEYNADLFVSDPKAIPSFCPDYARTERNIVIELMLRLANGKISEEDILTTFKFIGNIELNDNYTKYDIKSTIYSLVYKYFENVCAKYAVTEITMLEEQNGYYFISNKSFVDEAVRSLKCAYYVLEDEMSEKYYLDAKLLGHVYQAHLPGQYIVIGGKYYEIVFIEGEKGVVVRRAADHIHDREYYRQLRKYSINNFVADNKIGGRKTIGSIVVESGFMSFDVETAGYIQMHNYGDIKNSFKKEISNIPDRNYSNKYALKITLPGTDEQTRITIALLLNEVFKTAYSDNSEFICAVTAISEDTDVLEGTLYSAQINVDDEQCIYIIEDSILDMGLITSVERNLKRFFEIITDFLEWHKLALKPIPVKTEQIEVPQVKAEPENVDQPAENKPKGKKDWRSRRKEKKALRKAKRKKKKEKENPEPEEPEKVETEGVAPEEEVPENVVTEGNNPIEDAPVEDEQGADNDEQVEVTDGE